MKTIRIGTRGSSLALVQAGLVRQALNQILPDFCLEIVPIQTSGDIFNDVPLDTIGGKGVFVKDIEKSLFDGSIDIAVHSLKDMQARLPEGLSISAFMLREDPRDMLFSQQMFTLTSLPKGASIGTSSLRRKCQLMALRPDVHIENIRGNVPTRLKKAGSSVDAVVLAAAGVKRLGLPPGVPIDVQSMIPSPGQGIIAVESRLEDQELLGVLKQLDHEATRICAQAERNFLAFLGADCHFPVAAHARIDNNGIFINGMIGSSDGTTLKSMSMLGEGPLVGDNLARCIMEKLQKDSS